MLPQLAGGLGHLIPGGPSKSVYIGVSTHSLVCFISRTQIVRVITMYYSNQLTS